MSSVVEKLDVEIRELEERHEKLYNFLFSGKARRKLDEDQEQLLHIQFNLMTSYKQVLAMRYKLITGEDHE